MGGSGCLEFRMPPLDVLPPLLDFLGLHDGLSRGALEARILPRVAGESAARCPPDQNNGLSYELHLGLTPPLARPVLQARGATCEGCERPSLRPVGSTSRRPGVLGCACDRLGTNGTTSPSDVLKKVHLKSSPAVPRDGCPLARPSLRSREGFRADCGLGFDQRFYDC